ncbi:MAG: hypothetical protein FWD71_22945 [Oscillospiraceae bacterium]|nr:hypothetical protein [Oscillospiraceae bacterium]
MKENRTVPCVIYPKNMQLPEPDGTVDIITSGKYPSILIKNECEPINGGIFIRVLFKRNTYSITVNDNIIYSYSFDIIPAAKDINIYMADIGDIKQPPKYYIVIGNNVAFCDVNIDPPPQGMMPN